MEPRRARRGKLEVLLCILLLAAPRAASAFPGPCSWFGNGSSNLWSDAMNWNCSGHPGAPADGDTLIFPDGRNRPASIDDIASLQVAGIQITGRGAGAVRYALGTNGSSVITLAGPLTVNSPPAGAFGFGPQI